jgi:ribosomal protein S18 acetylase RimI-like enzyme
LLYVEAIGVTEAYRGRGHATALIDVARALAKEQRADRIELDTWGFNERAQRFFRSVGFDVRGIRMAMKT